MLVKLGGLIVLTITGLTAQNGGILVSYPCFFQYPNSGIIVPFLSEQFHITQFKVLDDIKKFITLCM